MTAAAPVRVSIEQRRGCGFRVEGGLYLVGPALAPACGALPVELHSCPTCGGGIKPSRGWTWVKPFDLLVAAMSECQGIQSPADCVPCPVSSIPSHKRAGLLWIGQEHYSTPSAFTLEASRLGISRRIPTMPSGFKVGETWVLLAHREVYFRPSIFGGTVATRLEPAIFAAFQPTAVERVVSEAEAADAAAMEKLRARGIEPVIVRTA